MEVAHRLVDALALGVEFCAALVISVGALEAFVRTPAVLFRRPTVVGDGKALWLRFAQWLVLGLEFQIAADVLKTMIAPTWTDIGQLAAIAAIRTGLNYFLERDIEAARALGEAR